MNHNETEELEANTCCGGCGGCRRIAEPDAAESADHDTPAAPGCGSGAVANEFLESLT
jgi:hypothetical protein